MAEIVSGVVPLVRLPERSRIMTQKVLDAGGEFLACGACLKLRQSEGSEICPLSTLKDQYEIVRDSDRLVTV